MIPPSSPSRLQATIHAILSEGQVSSTRFAFNTGLIRWIDYEVVPLSLKISDVNAMKKYLAKTKKELAKQDTNELCQDASLPKLRPMVFHISMKDALEERLEWMLRHKVLVETHLPTYAVAKGFTPHVGNDEIHGDLRQLVIAERIQKTFERPCHTGFQWGISGMDLDRLLATLQSILNKMRRCGIHIDVLRQDKATFARLTTRHL